ncbi:MAG: ComF family protein [Candidatus Zixiibacteriota bacterium]
MDKLISRAAEFISPVVELIYPQICLVCAEREASTGPLVCPKCWKALLRLVRLRDSSAGRTIPYPGDKGSAPKNIPTIPIYSLSEYLDPLAQMIQLFKFHGYLRLGKRLGLLLGRRTAACMRLLPSSRLVPAPLHFADYKRRGFNQAEILSDTLSKAYGLQVEKRLIDKPIKTKSQSRLSAEERAYNLAGAFSTEASDLDGAPVILVDDVITTGATISELGRTLSESGAVVVGAVALASALKAFTLADPEE